MPRISMKYLIVLCMIVCGLLPLAIASVVVNRQATQNLQDIAYTQLELDVLKRMRHLGDSFEQLSKQLAVLAESTNTASALQAFTTAIETLETDFDSYNVPADVLERNLRNHYSQRVPREFEVAGKTISGFAGLVPDSQPARALQFLYPDADAEGYQHTGEVSLFTKTTNYEKSHTRYHQSFANFARRFDYDDIYLIEPEHGHVVYSSGKGIDFGTSVLGGHYRESGMAQAAKAAFRLQPGETVFADLEQYLPSFGAVAAFMGAPVYSRDTLVGAVVVQVSVSRFNAIVADKEGLGETGDALIVGADGNLRTQIRNAGPETLLSTYSGANELRDTGANAVRTLLANLDGEEHLFAVSAFADHGLDWRIVAKIHTDEVLAGVRQLTRTTLIVALASVVCVTLFAFLLGRYFYRQLGGDPGDIRDMAKRIAAGDLGDAGQSDKAVGAYVELIGMRNKLREILGDASDIASQVRRGAIELSDANLGLSERTEQQAANLEETASSTEELTSTVKQNSDNLRSANSLAITTRDRAIESGDISRQAVESMQEISSASERISDIIGVIDEIAFQTNLLALNAAVEAARAGEQGRGFAVVASEVRQLAGRSASAAKEIKDLIEDSTRKVNEGRGLVKQSGVELSEIVESVRELTDIVGQISAASDEQSAGIEQINQALVSMDSMTNQNAQMVQDATTTSRDIRKQAEILSERIGYFSVASATGIATAPSVRSSDNVVELYGARQPEAERVPDKRVSGGEDFWDSF